ncbi:SCO4983 family protein [Streptomyces sp. IBSNAI002]|uniref:SCO4983 family protein n=1 Tax=Streptomyces sp. IBSNAI002 TaxID=3457500 RepID=UPI003FCF46CE
MYEPSRTKSVVHRMGAATVDYPHRSRSEALDVQLAGHLAALLAVTDELGLDEAAARIATQVARLRGAQPVRAPRSDVASDTTDLHQRAHDLAARALLVAASRADTTVAILAAERMDAHAAALTSQDLAGAL